MKKHTVTQRQEEQLEQLILSGKFTIESARKLTGMSVLEVTNFQEDFWTATAVNWCIKSGEYFNTFDFDIAATSAGTSEQFSHPSAWGYVLAKNPVLAVREAA